MGGLRNKAFFENDQVNCKKKCLKVSSKKQKYLYCDLSALTHSISTLPLPSKYNISATMPTQSLLYQGKNADILLKEEKLPKEIIKVLKVDYPDDSLIKQFNNEYNLTKKLGLKGVRRALEIGKHEGRHALWLEYIVGGSLKNNLQWMSLEDFLSIAIQITSILDSVHGQGIIHKDINPNNILFNPETREVTLIDFGLSSKYDTRVQYENNPHKIEGNLFYIAPEQTGRMNRSIDFRSDLYSLGATFYEMLTGRTLFEYNDLTELIHAHIAKSPVPADEYRRDIPEALIKVLNKLLEKNAEMRYQSAKGLLRDLEFIQANFNNKEALASFTPAKADISERFHISEKLYGREKELEVLLTASKQMAIGKKSMLLIGGSSGVGKSFLVHEVHKALSLQTDYYFIEGKFDQHQRSIPYLAWIQAFKMLSQSLMTLEESKLVEVRKRIMEAVGGNGKVLTEVVPSLEKIIGEQPEVAVLSGIEAQNRFNYVFQQFIAALASEETPLVLFIDDLQWADLASLKLLKSIISDKNSRYLLFLGAYRNNEVDATHPLTVIVEEIQSEEFKVSKLLLGNLFQADIEEMLVDATQHNNKTQELAKLIFDKTQGNAFFVNQFIHALYSEGLLALTSKGNTQEWSWDIGKIRELDITSNVVDLMVGKVQKLSTEAQGFLKPMACVGNKISITLLEALVDLNYQSIESALEQALREGLVRQTETHYKFAHDRVQQAVYSLIGNDERQSYHLQIAEMLHEKVGGDDAYIFEIASQYNQGLDPTADPQLKQAVGQINLKAGKQAKSSSAYASAQVFLAQAHALLDDGDWQNKEALLYDLYKELADVAYLNADFQQSQKHVTYILNHCSSTILKAEIYNMLIVQHTFQSEFAEALKVGVKGLELMNEPLPTKDLPNVLGGEIQKMNEKIGVKSIASLIDEPVMVDQEKIIATQLLVNLIPVAYLSGQMEQYAVISAKIINLALQHGHSPTSSHGYSNYGGVIAAMMGQYDVAFQFGTLALKLTEKFNNMYLRCKDSMLFANFMSPWVQHVKLSDAINKEGFQLGLESGELQYPGYISMFQVMKGVFRGEKLSKVLISAEEYIQFTNKTKHQWVNDGILMMKYGVLNMTDQTDGQLSFSTDTFDEQAHEKLCMERMSLNGVAFYHIMKAQTAYLYGKPEVAIEHLEGVAAVVPAIAGMIFTASYNFYYSLALLKTENALERLDQVMANQEQMEKWVASCPENFLHKKLLVEAEVARVKGENWKALELYNQAIEEARNNDFIQNEALANELLANLWITLGNKAYAKIHVQSAVQG